LLGFEFVSEINKQAQISEELNVGTLLRKKRLGSKRDFSAAPVMINSYLSKR
jgi:hypothetical protein